MEYLFSAARIAWGVLLFFNIYAVFDLFGFFPLPLLTRWVTWLHVTSRPLHTSRYSHYYASSLFARALVSYKKKKKGAKLALVRIKVIITNSEAGMLPEKKHTRVIFLWQGKVLHICVSTVWLLLSSAKCSLELCFPRSEQQKRACIKKKKKNS